MIRRNLNASTDHGALWHRRTTMRVMSAAISVHQPALPVLYTPFHCGPRSVADRCESGVVLAVVPPAVPCLEDVVGVVLVVTRAPLVMGDAARCGDFTIDLGERSVSLPVDRRSVAARRGVVVALAAVRPPKNLAYGGCASTVTPPYLWDATQCDDSIIDAGKRSERAGVFPP